MDLRHSTYPPIILAEKNIESDSIEIRQQNEKKIRYLVVQGGN